MGRLRVDRLCRAASMVACDGRVLVPRCHRAQRPVARLIGLLGTTDLDDGEGLWLDPCRSVHTWGMRMAIDVAFVDRDGIVVRVAHAVAPWRVLRVRRARSVLEAGAGALAELVEGDRLTLTPL